MPASEAIGGCGGASVPGPWHSSEAADSGRRRDHEEATVFPGVVDLHHRAVAVVLRERRAGEEEGVLAVGGDREQAGVEAAGPAEISSHFDLGPPHS